MGLNDLPTTRVILRDGRSLRLRPITPADKQRLLDFFARLSPHSRYLRFQYGKSYISDEEAEHFTSISLPQRCAYVATTGEGEQERIVGVGSWDALPEDGRAEVAFAVEDNIQLLGVGTALLEQLAEAAALFGIRRFEAQVLPENTRMMDVFDQSGLQATRRLEDGVFHYTMDLAHLEEYQRRRAYREHVARSAGVRHILYPRSIAVVGASRDPQKLGGAIFRNLLQGGFNGVVFPVNPNAGSVSGVLAYPSVTEVPGDVDLAIVAVPPQQVLDVVDQCARKGVFGLVVITAGFGETGPEGKERERVLRQKLMAYGMRLIGPNCLGVLNNDRGTCMNATFAPVVPPPGRVSMGSQSGALGLALLDYASSIGLGMAHFVSLGNKVDISSNDLLEFWEDNQATDVILLYLESFGNPRKFSRIARRVSRAKPIIAVKGGRSAAGARAAASHTGALASANVAVDALFAQSGVIRVNTIEEMFGVAQVLAYQPLPRGERVAIVTNAGGPGILAADACETWGLKVATLSESTQLRLRQFLPPEASVANPVDMIASATPAHYRDTVSAVLDDDNVDAVLFIYIPPLVTRPEDIAAAVREAVSRRDHGKPVLACFMMSRGAPAGLGLGQGRYIPSFIFPEDAVQALAHACDYARFREAPEGRVLEFQDVDRQGARVLLEEAPVSEEATWLPTDLAMGLLRAYRIPIVETVAAHSPQDAAGQAQRLGFPVAMKVRSSTIIHKSDVGGVVLGLRSREDVEQAYRSMAERLQAMGRGSEMQGVVLQPMAGGGQEMIIGMSQDPVFGPLVMVGLGGVQVEVLKDVAFSLHPLTDLDPDRMLRSLKSLPLLEGWRGTPPRDVEALKDVLLRSSALIEDFPEIEQVEINPLLVLERGRGCVAVDARVQLRRLQPGRRESRAAQARG